MHQCLQGSARHFAIACVGLLSLVILTVAVQGQRNTYYESEFFKLDSLFKGKPYDRRATPTQDSDRPTLVSVEMYLRSLGSINPVEMDYTADLYLRQRWIETRFVNNSLTRPLDVSDPELVKKIWKPEVYFPNAKSGDFQYVSVPNVLIRVHPSGEVLYILRLLLRFSCMMDLANYPLDTQVCSIETAVFSKTTRELQLTWFYSDPIKLYNNLRLPQFQVKRVQAEQCRYENKLGNYSCLEAKFLLDRNLGYHLVQSYIPSSLIVVISWVSFWLDVDAIPSRVTLGVTTLLTICSESSGTPDKMPPVSYLKALDIWMGVCTAFIFTALLEFTLVNQLSRPRRQMVCWVMHVTKGVPERQLYTPDLCEDWCIVRQQLKKKRDDMPSMTIQLVDGAASGGGGGGGGGGGRRDMPELTGRRCYCQRRMSAADWIDRISRLGFPLAFCAFGAFYWTHYNK